jgi:uncharacterized protein (DUF488 family)
MENAVFTIGHSTHTQQAFIELLEGHRITAVCDVRSKPYSRMNPQFNRENLTKALASHGIEYRFLGKELGARSEDPSCYEGDKVRYSKLANTQLFKDGLKRVGRGLKEGFRIALMCAEKEPLDCHRTILIAPQLIALGIAVQHIHADGQLESHDAASLRLARLFDLHENHMFSSQEESIADAYRLQEERIAFDRSGEESMATRDGAA